MRFAHAPAVFVLLAASVLAAAPAEVVHLPPAPVPPAPPAPPPGVPIKLVGTAVYDFTTTAPCVARAYPAALLTITSAEIPAGETFRDKNTFFDGATTRTYKGPVTLYNVRAAGVGKCELVITPLGLKLESDIKTVAFDVDSGQGPQPPPVPPGPTPPEPKPPAKSFRVIFVYESADNLTPNQRGVIYGKVCEDWLTANCTGGKAGWRRRDKDAPGENDATMSALWAAVKPAITVTPCVAIERDTKVEIIPLAATPAEMVKVFESYKGK